MNINLNVGSYYQKVSSKTQKQLHSKNTLKPCILTHYVGEGRTTRLTFSTTNLQQVNHILMLQQLKDLNLSEGRDRELNIWCKKHQKFSHYKTNMELYEINTKESMYSQEH